MTSSLAIAVSRGCQIFQLPAGPLFQNSMGRASIRPARLQHGGDSLDFVVSAAKSVSRFVAILMLALSFSAQVAGAESVGMITKVENQAQIGAAAAVVGSLVQTNDQVRTGPKSRLEISFRDNTKLTLGENATVVIDRYVFNPEESTGELVLSTSAAAFRMATGRLSAMRDKKINVSTPFAALAVRGTDFWWGPIEGQHGALLVSNSRLDVRNDKCDEQGDDNDRKRCKCAVKLDKSGEGTLIKHGCPGLPFLWPEGLVTSALSSTSFGLALGTGLAPVAAEAAAVAGAAAVSIGTNNPPKPPKVNDLNGGGCPPENVILALQERGIELPLCPPPDDGGGEGNPPVDPE